jgi:hypothetical protein
VGRDERGGLTRRVGSCRRGDGRIPTVRFLLSSRRPQVYSERTRGDVGGRVNVEHGLAAGPVITLSELLERQRALEAGAPFIQAEVVDETAEPIDNSPDGST